MPEDSNPRPNLPPASALVKLLGPTLIIHALRSVGLDQKVLLGFRETPKTLHHPVVNKRLEETLLLPGVLDALSNAWASAAGSAYSAIHSLLPDPEPETLAWVMQAHGLEGVQWGLLLLPDPEARELLQRIESLATSSQPGSPEGVEASGQGGLQDKQAADEPPNGAVDSRAQEREQGLQKALHRVEQLESSLREERRERSTLESRLQEGTREAADLRKKMDDARKSAEEWHRRAQSLETEARSSARLTERLQKALDEAEGRAAASERREKKLKDTAAQASPAVAAGADSIPEPPARKGAASTPSTPSSTAQPAEAILKRLMQKRRYGAVADFARELWEGDPGNSTAFGWLVEALTRSGRQEEAAVLYYEAGIRALEESRHVGAVEFLTESIRRAPGSPDVAWRIEKLLQTAEPGSQKDLEMVARLYGELKRTSASAAGQFESLARRVRRSLWRRLPAMMIEDHKRVAVSWPSENGSGELSASDLASAVAVGDAALVEKFRRWAASQHGELRQAALHVIEGAHAFLPGARRVLTGPTRRVLVDGSNVAWWGRTGDDGPDLDNIKILRHRLYDEGFFPVVILADAALPYQVKEQDRLRRWILRGEIHLVEGRTDADDTLLKEARRWECPIVTNDLMRDADPDGAVEKISFSIGPGGVALKENG